MTTVPWRRSRRPVSAPLEVWCARRSVGVEAVLRLPSVRVLVVEDACARIAYQAWRRRRPPRWRAVAHRRWAAEAQQMAAKAARVRALAEECLDGAD
ncbi:hypothetical protein [Streptomyces sp. ODS28]|uniref:hypothetical protein n=1 Tax=Streptomyces sp. ODS28 TaxID=3136688 RepID=UPI0031E90C6F